MKNFKKLLGFTLAEVMIVLTVIGILAGILIPVANNSRPDQNVMKFKKAHATLANVIHELVTSDKYYANGDLGEMPDGTLVNSPTYLCQSMADLLTVKSVNCVGGSADYNSIGYNANFDTVNWKKVDIDSKIDKICKVASVKIGEEIKTSDNIVYFDPAPGNHFGTSFADYFAGQEDPAATNYNRYYLHTDANKFQKIYKIFCLDIDGIPNNATNDDCINECPFGYGIRVDGKIYPGGRVNEWLEKGFQKGKNDN